jgi:hypothetical protein
MRFEVPQFINIPDKLFGPFTFKQALFLVGGGGMIYIIYRLMPFSIAVLLGLPIAAFTGALVFYKPNGRPFIHMVESWLLFSFSHKFYLWRQRDAEPGIQDVTQIHQVMPKKGDIPKDDRQRISDLAWSLDILDFDN